MGMVFGVAGEDQCAPSPRNDSFINIVPMLAFTCQLSAADEDKIRTRMMEEASRTSCTLVNELGSSEPTS